MNIINQLLLVYKSLISNFQVFITLSTNIIKAIKFIQALEEK